MVKCKGCGESYVFHFPAMFVTPDDVKRFSDWMDNWLCPNCEFEKSVGREKPSKQ